MQQIGAAQTMGASRSEILNRVILPSAKPTLLDTPRVPMGWAWTHRMVAQLVAANSGLSYAILKARASQPCKQALARSRRQWRAACGKCW